MPIDSIDHSHNSAAFFFTAKDCNQTDSTRWYSKIYQKENFNMDQTLGKTFVLFNVQVPKPIKAIEDIFLSLYS